MTRIAKSLKKHMPIWECSVSWVINIPGSREWKSCKTLQTIPEQVELLLLVQVWEWEWLPGEFFPQWRNKCFLPSISRCKRLSSNQHNSNAKSVALCRKALLPLRQVISVLLVVQRIKREQSFVMSAEQK